MKKTNKYKLSQWEKSDRIVMEDFNGDNAKVEAALAAHDTALAGKADAASVNSSMASLQTQLDAKATAAALTALQNTVNTKVRVICGAYTGDGSESRFISLGAAPKAVYVCMEDGSCSGGYQGTGGLALPGHPVVFSGVTALSISSTGFYVYKKAAGGSYSVDTNGNRGVYHYIAFC